MYPNYNEIASKLEIDKTYTIFSYNDFGFAYAFTFKLVKVEVKPYAQYRESMVIHYIRKGKRKAQGVRFHGDINRFAIWEGIVNPNVEMFNAPVSYSNGVTVQRSYGMSFSPCYMETALKSVPQEPMILVDNEKFNFIKEIK
jgi:hypothetical protein